MISNTYVIGLDSLVEKIYGEAMSLSPRQREAIKMVRDGRVQYGAEYPCMTRKGFPGRFCFIVDGHAAFGALNRTFDILAERGDIVTEVTAEIERADPGFRVPVELAKVKVNA